MAVTPKADAWERAILAHIARMPSSEITGEGTLYVKAAFHPGESLDETIRGEVFLSMPRLDSDPEWMRKVMQDVRAGFERDEIDVPYRVTLHEPGDLYGHHDDEVGRALLTLPATFKAALRADD